MIKKYEFWHPRLFETPFYLYLSLQCLRHGIGIKALAKANYALDHGEIGIGSKYQTQLAFNQKYFLPTALIPADLSTAEKEALISDFAEWQGYPVILKSDVGCVGKGVSKISSAADLTTKIPQLAGDYILQKYTPNNFEYGVFFVRHQGQCKITGINRKHFPTVTGNGIDSVVKLAEGHDRYTAHWDTFLQYFDADWVPDAGEKVQLSFIGSHTMGCKFTDDTHLVTPALEQAVFAIFEDQPGVNFTRVDVKAKSEAHFRKGEFVLIEINGVPSQPTHMFDPKYTVLQAYRIFFAHARWLAKIASEHKKQPMELTSYREIIRRIAANQGMLNQAHGQLMGK